MAFVGCRYDLLEFFYLDFDECSNNVADCHIHANCTNIIGSFNCECKAGFSGSGIVCSGEWAHKEVIETVECSDRHPFKSASINQAPNFLQESSPIEWLHFLCALWLSSLKGTKNRKHFIYSFSFFLLLYISFLSTASIFLFFLTHSLRYIYDIFIVNISKQELALNKYHKPLKFSTVSFLLIWSRIVSEVCYSIE